MRLFSHNDSHLEGQSADINSQMQDLIKKRLKLKCTACVRTSYDAVHLVLVFVLLPPQSEQLENLLLG